VDVGGGRVTFPERRYGVFVTRLSASGTYQWSRLFAPENSAQALLEAMAVDSAGRVVLGGSYMGAFVLGTERHVSAGVSPFVLALDAGGAVRWSKGFGGIPGRVTDVGVSPLGTVVAAGIFGDTLRWAGTVHAASKADAWDGDIFLVAAEVDGAERWGKSFATGAQGWTPEGTPRLAVDRPGSVVLAGTFAQPVDFGAGPLAPPRGRSLFVAHWGLDGALRWTRAVGAATPEAQLSVAKVALRPNHQVLLTGTFVEPTDFGRGVLRPLGGRDGFLLELAP
jgi:hypothetical protein